MKNQLRYRLICAVLLLVASLVAVSFARGQVLAGPGFLIKRVAAFTPLSLSPALWLDASDAATVTLLSSAVSQWSDKSGNAKHATQATAGNRPAYTTNVSVNFTGAAVVTVATMPAQYDFYIVHTAPSSNAGFRTVFQNTSNYHQLLWNGGTDNIGTYQGTFASAGSRTVNVKGLTTGRMDASGNISIGLDGNTISATLKTFSTNRDIVYIGNENGATQAAGNIHEILIYSANLSTVNQQKVEGYLAWKWGTVASLPAGHPYKTTAP